MTDPRMGAYLSVVAAERKAPLPDRLLALVLLRADAEGVARFEPGELARLMARDDRREGLPGGPLWRAICRAVERGWISEPLDHLSIDSLTLGHAWRPTPLRVRDTYAARLTVK